MKGAEKKYDCKVSYLEIKKGEFLMVKGDRNPRSEYGMENLLVRKKERYKIKIAGNKGVWKLKLAEFFASWVATDLEFP